jgi:hypothetical protein
MINGLLADYGEQAVDPRAIVLQFTLGDDASSGYLGIPPPVQVETLMSTVVPRLVW